MISFHTNLRLLATVPVLVFVALTLLIAIVPAMELSERYAPPSDDRDVVRGDADAIEAGRKIFVREGCAYCHTQQVRSDLRRPLGDDGRPQVLAQDARFGRASRPEDYASDDPPLLGSERVGPDLFAVGERLPSRGWHMIHLYDPRAVSPGSVMPAYRWYFRRDDDHGPDDAPIPLTNALKERLEADPARRSETRLWATPEAQNLVKYLLSRKPSSP